MKQEHRFVAELYRYLAPFVDTTHDVFLSLDGSATLRGVGAGVFTDTDVPDIWLRFIGNNSNTLLEAKVLNDNNTVTLTQGQLQSWRTGGNGAYIPNAWVAASRAFDTFSYWTHDAYLPRLDRCRARSSQPKVRIPEDRESFEDVRGLALHILREA